MSREVTPTSRQSEFLWRAGDERPESPPGMPLPRICPMGFLEFCRVAFAARTPNGPTLVQCVSGWTSLHPEGPRMERWSRGIRADTKVGSQPGGKPNQSNLQEPGPLKRQAIGAILPRRRGIRRRSGQREGDVRTVYVNGDYVPEEQARISIFDRGVLFADAVYEVCAVLESKLIDTEAHLARLRRSLREMGFALTLSDDEILGVMRQLVSRNSLVEGLVYLQVSRGVADRDFLPPTGVDPGVFAFTQDRPVEDTPGARDGLRVVLAADIRWQRRDIKTVGLLAPSLAKRDAKEGGADDAWLVEHGYVTEGTASNAWIVTSEGKIVTRPLSSAILAGCTRAAVLQLSQEAGLTIEERPFTPEEAREAAEAFVTGASQLVTGVVAVDGRVLSNGKPGLLTCRLREIYLDMARQSAV